MQQQAMSMAEYAGRTSDGGNKIKLIDVEEVKAMGSQTLWEKIQNMLDRICEDIDTNFHLVSEVNQLLPIYNDMIGKRIEEQAQLIERP